MQKVLIVEDSSVQAMALQQMLQEHGLQVWHANDGREGILAARNWHPDVIILDINMPQMDGFEVCNQLQKSAETSHIPIIMLTATTTQPILRKSLSLGAVDFIPKDSLANSVLLRTLRQMQIITG